MEAPSKQTSKLISYWLRHNPQDGGLQVDEFGWTSIDQLVHALAEKNVKANVKDLLQLNNSFEKVRWEIDTNLGKIRAIHGHSFPVILEDKASIPPGELYHGTSVKSVKAIAEKGLSAMQRQFVHLSATIEMAKSVGSRHGKPIIIEIETEGLVNDGWRFYQTSDNVWLTTDIPSKYLNFRPWFPIDTPIDFLVNELKREIGSRHLHVLFARLNKLKAVWQSSALDEALFQDQESGMCYEVHLTYTKSKQEKDEWPRVRTYKTLEDWFVEGLWNDQQCYYNFK